MGAVECQGIYAVVSRASAAWRQRLRGVWGMRGHRAVVAAEPARRRWPGWTPQSVRGFMRRCCGPAPPGGSGYRVSGISGCSRCRAHEAGMGAVDPRSLRSAATAGRQCAQGRCSNRVLQTPAMCSSSRATACSTLPSRQAWRISRCSWSARSLPAERLICMRR